MVKSVLVVLISLVLSLNVWAETSSVEVIVNHDVRVDELSLRDLRAIFSMKKRYWLDNSLITVYVLSSDDPIHREFSKKRLNVFPNQLESIWYRQVYTGTGYAPVTLSSIDEMITQVAKTPGAIGYIDHENLEKIKNNENIKVLTIR